MIGRGYWSTGIMVRYYQDDGWAVTLDFLDDGFCQDGSTEGTLRVRYIESELSTAIDTIKADAERLGIRWERPTIYMHGDGEDAEADYPRAWRAWVNREALRLGWRPIYRERVA